MITLCLKHKYSAVIVVSKTQVNNNCLQENSNLIAVSITKVSIIAIYRIAVTMQCPMSHENQRPNRGF